MHYSCILVTQPSKNEPVGPIEVVKTEPGVEFLVEPEENQDKQLSMILCIYSILCIYNPWLVISMSLPLVVSN